MKKFSYRLYAILLLITMVLSGSVFSVNALDTAEETTFIPIRAQEFDALNAMNLLTDDFLSMSANTSVTRAQFVGALYKLAGGPENNSFVNTPFSDVNESTPFKEAISYFYNMGIVNGTSSNIFSPNNEISYFQALKITIDFLGYHRFNKALNDLYVGYTSLAVQFGLMDGLKISSFDDAISAEAAVVLLYNCAITRMIDTEIYVNDGTEIGGRYAHDCPLEVYHSIYSGRGKVEVAANSEIYLNETIVINKNRYQTEGKDFSEFLGCDVRFFYKKSGDGINTLLWAMLDASNEILTINSNDLLIDDSEYDFDKIIYTKENADKRLVAEVDPYADIVYNNALYNNGSIDIIKPKSGSIKLVDNNGNGIYDVVIVKEFTNIFVSAISVGENFIADKYGDALMLDEYEFVKIFKNGEEIPLNLITNNCVVSCLKSPDKKFVYIYVNDSGFSETLKVVTTKSGETYYTFDSGEYCLAESFKKVIADQKYSVPEIVAGGTYRYFLDINGEIAAITKANNTGLQYAYLIAIGENKEAFTQDSVLVKLVLQDGSTAIAVTADKLKIDNVGSKKGTDLPTSRVNEVVKVRFDNDGALKEIDYAEAINETTNPYGYDATKFTLDCSETNSFYYRNYLFDNRYAIGADTVCFARFIDKDGNFEYGLARMSDIPNNVTYTNIKIYDCNEYRDIGALVIDLNRRDRFNSGHILLNEVVQVAGEDGEIYTELTGLVRGQEVTYTVKVPSVVQEVEDLSLKRGDIIMCSTYLNEVYRVQRMCRLSDKNAPFIDTTTHARQSDSRIFGYLYSNNGNNIVLMNPNGWTSGGKLLVTKAVTVTSNLSVSVYDSKSDTVYPGSAKDLYPTNSPQLDGSLTIPEGAKKVYIYREAENVGEIIVAYY